MRSGWVLAVVVGGCVRVERADRVAFDVAEVSGAQVRLGRGDLVVDASAVDDVVADITTWGFASRRASASARAGAVQVDATLDAEGVVTIRSLAPPPQAGADIALALPPVASLDARLDQGNLDIADLEGVWDLRADRVRTVALAGEGAIVADAPSDVEVWPYVDGVVSIEARGDLTLRLPAFGPYDIVVAADPGFELFVENLGFDVLDIGPGFVQAWRSPGTVRVDVVVSAGTLTLIESR